MRILLVDDHPAMRYGVRYLLDAAEGLEVVGEGATAVEAVRLARELRPDLVLLDLRLEGEDSGIEACREIKGASDALLVVLFTAHTEAEDVAAAVLAGADGYLHKGVAGERLAKALQRVEGGEKVWLLTTANQEARERVEGAAEEARLTPKAKSSRSCSGATRTPKSPRSCTSACTPPRTTCPASCASSASRADAISCSGAKRRRES